MARTIGRRRPQASPPGDYLSMCDICGTGYYRYQLIRKPDGLLYCRDDLGGMDRIEIADALKAASSNRMRPLRIRDGGNFDHLDDPDVSLPFTPPSDPSGGEPGDGI